MLAPRVQIRVTENLPSGPRLRHALAVGLREGLPRVQARAERQWELEAPRSQEGPGLEVQVQEGVAGVEASLGTPRFEARLLEIGTRAHEIRPRTLRRRRRRGPRVQTRRVLAFALGGGRVLFRRVVRHPGQRPTYWLSRSVQAGLPDVRAAIEDRLREAFRG